MTAMLEPGTYKLLTDVSNPAPDRRHTRDWRMLPTWKQGWEFLVVEKRRYDHLDEDYLKSLPEGARAKLREESRYTVIQLVGDRWASLHEIGPGHAEQYAALQEQLVKVKESHEAMFTRLGTSTYAGFSEWLVTSGKISPELFESWWKEYQTSDDDGDGGK